MRTQALKFSAILFLLLQSNAAISSNDIAQLHIAQPLVDSAFVNTASVENMLRQASVKWFDHQRGYGLIKTDSGEQLFIHFSNIRTLNESSSKALKPQQRISYQRLLADDGSERVIVWTGH